MNWTWGGYAGLMKWCLVVSVVFLVAEIPATITGFVPASAGSISAIVLGAAGLVLSVVHGRQARRHALANDREPTGWVDLVARLPMRSEG